MSTTQIDAIVDNAAEVSPPLLTADVLWWFPQNGLKYELSKGELIEMAPPGGTHGKYSLRLGRHLQSLAETNRLGETMTEAGFYLQRNPDTVRAPDVSFLAAARIPPGGLPEGYIPGPPDLAVEIVSPHDTATEIQQKVEEYLAAGTRLVWIVYPRQRSVVVHYPNGTARTLREADSLDGEDVVPGFSCPLADIFR
jgi:Uma2 family endonuclease